MFDGLRALIERVLPWYDAAAEARRARRKDVLVEQAQTTLSRRNLAIRHAARDAHERVARSTGR